MITKKKIQHNVYDCDIFVHKFQFLPISILNAQIRSENLYQKMIPSMKYP